MKKSKFKKLNLSSDEIIKRNDLSKITGAAALDDQCPVGKPCWHGGFQIQGTCYPVNSYTCMCVAFGQAVYSYDCQIIA